MNETHFALLPYVTIFIRFNLNFHSYDSQRVFYFDKVFIAISFIELPLLPLSFTRTPFSFLFFSAPSCFPSIPLSYFTVRKLSTRHFFTSFTANLTFSSVSVPLPSALPCNSLHCHWLLWLVRVKMACQFPLRFPLPLPLTLSLILLFCPFRFVSISSRLFNFSHSLHSTLTVTLALIRSSIYRIFTRAICCNSASRLLSRLQVSVSGWYLPEEMAEWTRIG